MADPLVKQAEIFDASLVAVRQIIGGLMPLVDGRQPSLPEVISTTNIFKPQVDDQGREIVPAAAIRVDTVRAFSEHFNKSALKHGIRGIGRFPDRTVPIFSLVGIQCDLNVYFADRDFNGMLTFVKKWMYEREHLIGLDNADVYVDVHLSLADTVSMPTPQEDQPGHLYRVESGCILTTYIGTVNRTSMVKQINTNINSVDESTDPVTLIKEWTLRIDIDAEGHQVRSVV